MLDSNETDDQKLKNNNNQNKISSNENGKAATVKRLEKSGLIVIQDNVNGHTNETDIYFHGHTLGLASSVLISSEEINRVKKWIELIDNKKETPSYDEINFIVKYIKQYIDKRIEQARHLLDTQQKTSLSSEKSPELEKLLNMRNNIEQLKLAELSGHLKKIIKQKILEKKELTKKENQNKVLLAVSDDQKKQLCKLSDPKQIIYDPRFRDNVFLPIQLGQTAVRLNAWCSGGGFSNLADNLPQRYVMANCLFAGNLQGKTDSGKIYPLITHNLQVDLSEGAIKSLQHIKTWSPYEMVMFAQFEKQLEFIKAVSGSLKPVIHYHLPATSYILTALNQAVTRNLNFNTLKPYFDAVSERAKAHQHIIQNLSDELEVKIVIESPFDNIGNIENFIRKNLGDILLAESSDLECCNLILQALRENTFNITHRDAWRKVLPENVAESRNQHEWKEKLPKTIDELLHLANAMMIAIANEANNGEKKQNFKACSFHSWDEKPIPRYYAKYLSKTFGECLVLEVFPEVVYYGHEQGNNLFRVTPETSKSVLKDLKEALVEHYQSGGFLKEIFQKDNIENLNNFKTKSHQKLETVLFGDLKDDDLNSLKSESGGKNEYLNKQNLHSDDFRKNKYPTSKIKKISPKTNIPNPKTDILNGAIKFFESKTTTYNVVFKGNSYNGRDSKKETAIQEVFPYNDNEFNRLNQINDPSELSNEEKDKIVKTLYSYFQQQKSVNGTSNSFKSSFSNILDLK